MSEKEATERVTQSLFEAVGGVIDRFKESEDEDALSKIGPVLITTGVMILVQTIGEEARDLVAVQAIMGHAAATNDMSAVYRQRVSDERLRAVVDAVREWLFG